MRWEESHDGVQNSRLELRRKNPRWRRAENGTLCSEGADSRVHPLRTVGSRCRVDTGQECRARRANKTAATSLVSGKH